MRPAKLRRLAREVLPFFMDGRPVGCTCPANPGVDALPCDNRHVGAASCPLTPAGHVDGRWPEIQTNRGGEYVPPPATRTPPGVWP